MKSIRAAACALGLVVAASLAQAKCNAHVGRSDADAMALVATPSALTVGMDGDHRMVTTLGTITNPSGACITDVVVEVQYFDAAGQHVDTLVEPLVGLVAPAGEAVEFRAQGLAAKDAKAYATQRARVVDGSVRWVKGPEASHPFLDMLLSWAPMLLLIAVWAYFVRKQSGAKSLQAKMFQAMEKQIEVAQAQGQALQRVADALERGVGARGRD